MAHKVKGGDANEVGFNGVRLESFLGSHGLEFIESQDTVFKESGQEATRVRFKVLKAGCENLAQGVEVERTVFVGIPKHKGYYYYQEMRQIAAAILGLDPLDDSVDWNEKLEEIDGPDNKHAGAKLVATVYEDGKTDSEGRPYRKVRYVGPKSAKKEAA